MKNPIWRTAAFLLVLTGVIASLRLLDWFGQTISVEGVRTFPSIEEARHRLKTRGLYLPSYFPDYLEWPPFEILGQTAPYKLVIFHIRRQNSDQIVLALRQVDATIPDPIQTRLEPFRAVSQEEIQLDEHSGLLQTGSCADGTACTRISWSEQQQTLTVILKDGRDELLKIASSMEREP